MEALKDMFKPILSERFDSIKQDLVNPDTGNLKIFDEIREKISSLIQKLNTESLAKFKVKFEDDEINTLVDKVIEQIEHKN